MNKMHTSTYKAQCKTFTIAKELAGTISNVSSFNGAFKPPYCLRIVKKYRTPVMQQFRNDVAKMARSTRK
jgi:hypothetical protein